MGKKDIIVVCPIRDEEWILERFLTVTSQFADSIIVADQHSSDGSREICRRFDKVILVENPSVKYNEAERQKLLLQEARKLPEPRIILALDADEILAATLLDSIEWQKLQEVEPGTVIQLALAELWLSPHWYKGNPGLNAELVWRTCGYVDDGAEHEGKTIHSERIPVAPDSTILRLNEIIILHYALVSWQRWCSKERWYRCYQRTTFPEQSPVERHRQYSGYKKSMLDLAARPVPREWLSGWQERGIDMTSVREKKYYWWDWEVLRMISDYGAEHFRHEDIWCFDWERARLDGLSMGIHGLPEEPVVCPRTIADRMVALIRDATIHKRFQGHVDNLLRRVNL